MSDRKVIVWTIVALAVMVGLVALVEHLDVKECRDHGGVRKCHETQTTGIMDGKPVLLTSTDCKCMLPDGGEYQP